MTGVVLVLAMLLLLAAAWVRAAGTAVTRVPRADALRDDADGRRGAALVAELLDEREAITPAVGVVVSGLLVVATVLSALAVSERRSLGAAILPALLLGVLIFVLGDPIPRSLGRWRPHRIAYGSAWLLALAVRMGGWANDLLSEPENQEVATEPQAPEEVEEQERELIDSVLEFSETLVREVMTPRPDMVTIPTDATIDELISLASDEGYSRLPVTSNGDIVGIAIVKDLLTRIKEDKPPRLVSEVMRPIAFVPETKHASALLNEMREQHLQQVIVVDEFGDIAGLVTIEDLIEELVGEISDETDEETQTIVARGLGWDVDARASIDELSTATGVELPDEDWDTVGGLVLGLAERVPEVGETFRFSDLVFKVTRMQGRRVAEVNVVHDTRIEAV
ncbi:MAG: CBS domain-containing protein [Actinobacteria bacterium]|nr:CBS domain-containing protein [Actinomycetota bacterium]